MLDLEIPSTLTEMVANCCFSLDSINFLYEIYMHCFYRGTCRPAVNFCMFSGYTEDVYDSISVVGSTWRVIRCVPCPSPY
ncbi:hypothetical protein EG68_07380 [Paragonimus skrjabini miyazakii]|uniref:Uncharacterized protein n=1 Tax=Paragonimus skrjabini miyazakii TaxID=59628 RepID=A0A8S9YYS8_9TREM|nr:hypothetical protein EG68_07380 [Paragonimus skrjabini miyazakii]